MIKILFPLALLTLIIGCNRPDSECTHVNNRPECETCCVENSMEFYAWGHLDQECFCDD